MSSIFETRTESALVSFPPRPRPVARQETRPARGVEPWEVAFLAVVVIVLLAIVSSGVAVTIAADSRWLFP